MKRTAIALAFALIAGSASAITIDFEGIADGQAPGETYAAQGVHFTGGIVQYNQLGAYVAGQTTVRFDAPIDRLNFGADGLTIDSNSFITYADGSTEPQYLGSMSWVPYGPTFKRDDWYAGQVWDTTWPFRDMVSITFNTAALDNLRFDVGLASGDPETGTVPEPATLALLGLGALGLLRRQGIRRAA